jgi:AcrR family transcriptional regulator
MNYIKEQLAITLFDLIKTKEFSDISISELVNKAGVGRASFYRKYTSKEDVLSQYIIEKLEQWKKDFDTNPSGDFVVSVFNYLALF